MNPPATIVIPLLRQKDDWLERAVRSAVEQTVPCETIVVRSRETPGSNLALLNRLASESDRLRIFFRDLPAGFPQTINFGIRASTAPRIGLLLSDDWLEPRCVEACLAEDADIVSTSRSTWMADGITPLEGGARRLRMKDFLSRPTLESRASYLTHFFLFRKEAMEQVGLVDESIGDYPGIDDYHFIWTLLENHASVGIVEDFLYNYRDHDSERLTLADPEQAVRNLRKILTRHGVTEPDFSRLVASHSRWYGRSLAEVLGERNGDRG